MNMLREIEIEVEKIKKLITGYTSDGTIITTLDFLSAAITEGDKEEILYHLADIANWYRRNLNNINDCDYVFNFDEHLLSAKSIDKMVLDLEKFEGSLFPTQLKQNEEGITEEIVFISHSNLDKAVVDLFANEIKKFRDDVDYTSIVPMNPLNSGEDFIEGILERIKKSKIIIACLSPNFYASVVCQIEMGMAYTLGKKISPLIISLKPNHEKNLKGVFNSNTKADHIYKEDELISLLEKIDPTVTPGLISQYAKNIVNALPDDDDEISPNNSNNEFFKMYHQGMISEKETVFLQYIAETRTFNYLWGWQENDGLECFEHWLTGSAYHIDLPSSIYHSFVQLMVHMELLEASQFTEDNNVKEYKMKKEYIEQVFSFTKGTQS